MSACKALDWQTTPITVIDFENILHGELAENVIRKDFLPSEAVAIADAVREKEQVAAKERQGTRTDKHSAKLAQGSEGKTREKLASYVGVSHASLTKATEVVRAAEADPDRFGHLVAEMDRTVKAAAGIRALTAGLAAHGRIG